MQWSNVLPFQGKLDMSKVHWSSEELELLAKTLAEMRLRDPLPSLMVLLREAQMCLPSERRRYSLQVVPEELVDLVHQKLIREEKTLESFDFREVLLFVADRFATIRPKPSEPKKLYKVIVAGLRSGTNDIQCLMQILPRNISIIPHHDSSKLVEADLYVVWSTYASQIQRNALDSSPLVRMKLTIVAGPISAVANRIKEQLGL